MCFGSKQKVPDPGPPPDPTPPPPTPAEPGATQTDVKKQIDKYRFGLASTIKTGPRGITGSGADLYSDKKLKTKLGV